MNKWNPEKPEVSRIPTEEIRRDQQEPTPELGQIPVTPEVRPSPDDLAKIEIGEFELEEDNLPGSHPLTPDKSESDPEKNHSDS